MTEKGAQAYLRELIQLGALQPGDDIEPVELADRLGLDEADVLGGVANLEAFGILERSDNGTYRVRVIGPEEMYEFMRMRVEIEVRVAEALAFSASIADLEDLRAEIGDQRKAAILDQRMFFLERSARFHQLLAERANFLHGARVFRTWEDFQQIVGMRALEDPHAMLEAVHEHEALLNCIEAHDRDGAGQAIRTHLSKTLERWRRAAVNAA